MKFKSASKNNMLNSRVLIVGIGNSAVDTAVNLVNEGKYIFFSKKINNS